MHLRKLLPFLLILIGIQTACSFVSGTTQTEPQARSKDSTSVQKGANESETIQRGKPKAVNKSPERTREAQRPLETR